MENNNHFNAEGQLLFIEPTWITGETCVFRIYDPLERATTQRKLAKIRKDFVSRLEQVGFVITYDKKNIANDTICFIMNDESISKEEVDLKTIKKEFDNRMFQAGGDKLNYPYTLTVEEYFQNPFFPAVFKNEAVNGGIDKFLIETPEQLEIIKRLYVKIMSDKRTSTEFSTCIFQQLIETPTKYQTYMRVLMSASGDVMGASLRYSRVSQEKREPEGIFEQYFWNEQSDYFLNCKGMFNYYSEGEIISFTQPRYSSEKQAVLKSHGINPNNPEIPSEILEVSASIAKNCNQELGIMCGIDFILNEKDGKWYYLEIQSFPAIEEWATSRNIRLPNSHSTTDYVKYCAFELEARYEALIMVMNQKKKHIKMKKKKPDHPTE